MRGTVSNVVYVLYCGEKTVMSDNTFSVIVKCWYDTNTDATHLQIVRTDTAEEARLSNGTFLLRISVEGMAAIERCYIRHIASGREAYIQGSPNLRAFVKACLLNDGSIATNDLNTVGDDTSPTE